MIDEVDKILHSRNVQKSIPLPPKFALPILENAVLEENDELQDLWNNLLANSLDPNSKIEIRYAFIEVIKSLIL